MNFVPDIRVVQEDDFICPLLQTGVIICDMLQVNLRRPCLSLGVARYRNPLNDGVIIITIHQTKLNLRRTGAVVVQKIVPDNLNIVSTRQLTPLSVKVQRPVTTVRDNTGVFRVRLSRTSGALMIHQQVAKALRFICVQELALGFRTGHTAAIKGRVPVHILPANRIIQTCKQRQQVIIVVILGLQNTCAVTCIIIRYDNTLRSPACVICPPRLNTFLVALKRLRAVRIKIPAVKRVALTNRLHIENRKRFTTRNNLFLIVHFIVAIRKCTAIGHPCSSLSQPNCVIRIKCTRVCRCC